jgi:WD repeat and SOF domain-containing protein 1
MEKMFAKPFIAALDTHNDGVTAMAKSRGNLVDMLSGSADGEIIFWNLPERRPIYQLNAHSGFVRGVTFSSNHSLAADTHFVSTGQDNKVCIWSLNGIKDEFKKGREEFKEKNDLTAFKNYQPKASYESKTVLLGCDHSYEENSFATAGQFVQVWNYERSSPLHTFDSWNIDTVSKVKFNPSEYNLLASVSQDRSLVFYDLRGKSSLQRIHLKNKSSALCWNP